jgi:hypothetical protein
LRGKISFPQNSARMKKTFIIFCFLSGFVVASTLCAFLFFFYFRPVPPVEVTTPNNTAPTPPIHPAQTPLPAEIRETDVTALSLNTVYPGFFPEDSKCRKSYNELFGQDDGFYSAGSPCTIDLIFNRDGSATKTVDLRRYDRESKTRASIEKSSWTARITEAQFNQLAGSIVKTEIFKNWNDMVMINVVNTRIRVAAPPKTRTLMSNVDEKTVNFLPLMDAFKKLDNEVKWERKP